MHLPPVATWRSRWPAARSSRSASARWIPEAKRSIATGIVNAGGSFGQFTVIPLAQLFIGLAGWQPAMVILGALSLLSIPAILWVTQGHAEHLRKEAAAAGGVP